MKSVQSSEKPLLMREGPAAELEIEESHKKSGLRRFARQDKRGPVVRVRMLRAETVHRVAQRIDGRRAIGDASIQPRHQRRRALVVDVPEAQKQRVRTCTEQPACNAEQLVACSSDVGAGGATAQC